MSGGVRADQRPNGTPLGSILAECLLFDTTRRLPFQRLALHTLVVVVAALLVEPRAVTRRHPFTTDGHAITSLDDALNTSVCHRPSAFYVEFLPGYYLSRHESASYVPVRQVLATLAGSVDAYCTSPRVPYVNEDNALGLLEGYFLDVRPNASVDQIGRFLSLLRFGLVVGVCALFLSLGASVVFCVGVAVEALALNEILVDAGLGFSTNPFLFVLVLANAAVVYGALRLAGTRRLLPALVGAAVAGFTAAASVNMRSSYLPVYVSFLGCYCWAVWRVGGWRPPRGIVLGSAVLVFGVGYSLFQYPFVIRRMPSVAAGSYHHSITHPLVLALAMPPSSLSKREGIEWVDEVGTTLAQRIDPKTTYQGPGYEKALFTYYTRLWRQYPREMAAIYFSKLRLAGAHMMQTAAPPLARKRAALWPLFYITNGLCLFGVFVGSAAIAFIVYRRSAAGLAFCIGLLCLAGALLYLESAIIMPFYYVSYQNYLLFISLLWCLLLYQGALNGAARALGWTSGGSGGPSQGRA